MPVIPLILFLEALVAIHQPDLTKISFLAKSDGAIFIRNNDSDDKITISLNRSLGSNEVWCVRSEVNTTRPLDMHYFLSQNQSLTLSRRTYDSLRIMFQDARICIGNVETQTLTISCSGEMRRVEDIAAAQSEDFDITSIGDVIVNRETPKFGKTNPQSSQLEGLDKQDDQASKPKTQVSLKTNNSTTKETDPIDHQNRPNKERKAQPYNKSSNESINRTPSNAIDPSEYVKISDFKSLSSKYNNLNDDYEQLKLDLEKKDAALKKAQAQAELLSDSLSALDIGVIIEKMEAQRFEKGDKLPVGEGRVFGMPMEEPYKAYTPEGKLVDQLIQPGFIIKLKAGSDVFEIHNGKSKESLGKGTLACDKKCSIKTFELANNQLSDYPKNVQKMIKQLQKGK